MKQQLLQYFSLPGFGEIVLNSSVGGYVRINSLSIKDFPWNGSYFQDIPVSLEAIPDPGYTFDGWYNGDLIDINPLIVDLVSDTTYLSALFSPTNSLNSLRIITPLINVNIASNPSLFSWAY